MFKSLKLVRNFGKFCQKRTFLSPAYYCNEVWENRLTSPLLQKVNLDTLYYDLDQGFQETRQISPIDVDIFANSVTDNLFFDELMDLAHKLRLSAQTGGTLESTPHAIIRAHIQHNKMNDLLLLLDDRLNFGIFLDAFTANMLFDIFWKNKNHTAGAVIASQLMLQEDFSHPISTNYALLHCYNYLLNPAAAEWPRAPPPEETEEDIMIRVKYLRNPYDDNHFDLKDPAKIVGKTLIMATKGKSDLIDVSLNILGCALFYGEKVSGNVHKAIIDLIPEDLRQSLNPIEGDVQELLQARLKESVQKISEQDIKSLSEVYYEWERQRVAALEVQKKRIKNAQRLEKLDEMQAALKTKEQKLWFFDNQENIELGIEEKEALKATGEYVNEEKEAAKTGADYVPPEIVSKGSN